MTSRKFSLRCLAALPRFAVRYPGRVVLLALLVTMAAVPGLWQLKLRTDGHALVSEDDPVVRYDQLVCAQFGIEDHIVVLVQASPPDGIYNPATLELVRELTAAFQRLPGVNAANIFSLATEPGLQIRPGTLQFQTLLETPRETKPQLDQLREELRKIRLYTGTLVSYDGLSTAILIGAPGGSDRTRLYRTIYQIIGEQPSTGDRVRIIGAPVAESLLGIHILEDLGVPQALLGAGAGISEPMEWKAPESFYELRLLIARKIGLLPIAIGVMALIFYASFRRVGATLLPLMEVGACLLFVFGLMGWCDVPIYLTIAVMPVILTAMGVSDEIYIFKRYLEQIEACPRVRCLVKRWPRRWRSCGRRSSTWG